MKNLLLYTCFSILSLSAIAQKQGDGGTPNFTVSQLQQYDATDVIQLAKPDIKRLQQEDAAEDAKGNAWRFGYNHEVSINSNSHGEWMSDGMGGSHWLLSVKSPDALSINLTFINSVIPEGNELYVYNANQSVVLGKFTAKHLFEGALGTDLLKGDQVFIEYHVAAGNPIGYLELSTVTHGYRGFDEFMQKNFGGSGSCNMNVNCPDGLPYEDIKRSVMLLVSGANKICTGALINNTAYDGKPYVLTANHCYNSNAPSWVFRFNYESPTCDNPSTEPTTYTSLSGCIVRARRLNTDFLLLEIAGGLENGTVPAAINPYFAGWDRSGNAPASTIGIHHPAGDVKKISFDDQPSMATQATIGGVTSMANGVWKVIWDRNTTTQPVSSGSPLFDNNRRIIGQLWGGGASCSNLTGPDYYGRVSMSWNQTGSDSTNQLQYWLDPQNVGALVIDGMEPGTVVQLDAGLTLDGDVTPIVCGSTLTPTVRLYNFGQTALTNATISYALDGGTPVTFNWTGNLAFLGSTSVALPNATVASGLHSIVYTVSAPNGGVDNQVLNNSTEEDFTMMNSPTDITLEFNLDCYASETSWQLRSGAGATLVSSPNYVNTDMGQKTYDYCLSEGCYKLYIFDQYTDGMSGCPQGNGSVRVLKNGTEVLGEMTQAQAGGWNSYEIAFCVGPLGIENVEMLNEVYPNPTSGKINWTSNDVVAVTVVDVSGKEVAITSLDLQQKQLSLQGLSTGLYLVKFTGSTGLTSQKRILVH